MTVQEDILAKLMAGLITKTIEEPGQVDINTLEQELAEKAAKKIAEDMVEKGCKHWFLVVVLCKNKFGKLIGNPGVQWTTPKDSGEYDE